MSGRHVQSASGGRARIWLAGLGLVLATALVAVFAGPAGAASKTVDAQLSLSGLASADNPLGGSQIGLRPGDKVTFSAAGLPTAGLQKAGLGGLVSGLTGLLAKFRVVADFSKLPGGAKNTVLTDTAKKTFTFPKKGTFTFTWSFQSVNLLGGVAPLPPIDFTGNQLKKLGITLNASNQYVGRVVSATNPPPGGLSVQLPGVSVAPKLPVVGQLPTVSIPGLTLPTLSVPVPDLNPGGGTSGSGGAGSGKTGGGSTPTGSGTPTPSYDFAPPGISVPQQVVPGGTGVGGGSGGGGFRLGVVGNGSNGQQLGVPGTGSGTSSGSGSTTGGQSVSGQSGGGDASTQPVDLASSSASPSSQLPVLLAILAVITLAMVAGTYARLYLLGRKRSSG